MLGLFSSLRTGLAAKAATYSTCSSPKVAVVLSGCGVYDGTEIHEAAAVLSHLTRRNAVPQCFAPKMNHAHIVNHVLGKEEEGQCRCVLAESARIARGNIQPLCQLLETANCYHAVVFPGGFGVAKNLSDFALKGSKMCVHPEVEKVIREFHCKRKPIALACIAPILVAKLIPCVTITLGKSECGDKWPYREAINQAKCMGANVEERDWNEVSFDCKNMVFSTPAYMYCGEYHQISDGIGNMICYMLNIMTKEASKGGA